MTGAQNYNRKNKSTKLNEELGTEVIGNEIVIEGIESLA